MGRVYLTPMERVYRLWVAIRADLLAALAWNVAVLLLSALILLPLGRGALLLDLAKGLGVLWCALAASTVLLVVLQRIFRVDDDTHYDAYVLSNLFVGAALLVAWSAWAAQLVHGSVIGTETPVWKAALLWFVGLLSAQNAYTAVTMVFQGSVYKGVNLPLSLASFVLFAAWPAVRALFG